MALILVAFISTLVQMYSTEYVRGDRRYTHFFASPHAVLGRHVDDGAGAQHGPADPRLGDHGPLLVPADRALVGGRGNSRAPLKAFFTVRVGDVGLLVGTAMLLGASSARLDIARHQRDDAGRASSTTQATVLMWAAVALFIACIGKSGQFPLHTWLPDAMAGPTPVSSLLHSSTMVVAGVFLVARLYPVFHVGLEINMAGQDFNLIAVIGGITILIAALLAFVQNDIKKVLAYSTVSQLGYMMMGLGVGAWTRGRVPHLHPRLLQVLPVPLRRLGEPHRPATTAST